MQEKLALRKRLREEKEAKGEAVDEEALDELVEEEDKKIQATVRMYNPILFCDQGKSMLN